jgi:hypothetical protein
MGSIRHGLACVDYSWTTNNEPAISHLQLIDSGASGEVHKVSPDFRRFGMLIGPSYRTSDLVRYCHLFSHLFRKSAADW